MLDSDSYISILNPDQKKAVVHEGSPLLILAGAGSGKTRVITTKIAYLIAEKHVDPFSILAVTFTKKAANEMKERAVSLEPRAEYAQIRTFHSWGSYFLRTHASDAGIDKNFTVYDDDDMVTLLSKAVPSLSKQQASVAAHKISLAKDYCYTPDSEDLYKISEDPSFRDIYDAYERRLRETGNVDFGDLILLPYLVLKNNDFVRHELHRRYRVIMVDEYQDSNVAQFKLLHILSGIDESDDSFPGSYVCVVGDDDQSIYKFRGADINNILNFQNQFPGTALVRLETNYRSSSEILACADSVVKNNEGRLGKTLVSARGKGKIPTLVFLPTQDDETQFCAEIIEQAHSKGISYSEWAILYRTNAQSLGFESEFLHRKIPYSIVGSLKFYEREEVKDILAWISLIANPKDEIAFRRVVNKPARGIGNASQDKIIASGRGISLLEGWENVKLSKKCMEALADFCESVKECQSLLSEQSQEKLSSFIENVIKKSGLEEHYAAQDEIAGTQKIANLQELINSAVLYPCSMQGLLDFMDHIQLDRTIENEEEDSSRDCVTLITLHNTKGLEFPRVIITGMESGIFPREDKSGEEIEEERRLFYVGITRAQNELYLTSCGLRRLYGRTNYMSPSPFLNEIDKDLIRVIGEAPVSFSSEDPELASIVKKYKKGVCVYHDDYGHGQIVHAETSDEGEYVISVKFETGGFAKFLPKYQSKSLIVED
ncbi:MAG: ATP-dependent helicase [Treponema sp.]|nr:ATP-dependent helicase [Treponema sp.]